MTSKPLNFACFQQRIKLKVFLSSIVLYPLNTDLIQEKVAGNLLCKNFKCHYKELGEVPKI